jgi:hypothetical protein
MALVSLKLIPMKKLILLSIILLFAVDVNAQSAGPNELHCTEEAFTFRTGIRQGWHFSAPVMGPPELPKNTSTYGRGWNFKSTDALSESGLSPNADVSDNADSFSELILLRDQNITFYPLLYHIKLADQLKYLFPGNFQLRYQAGIGSTKSILQNQIQALR